MKFWITTNDYIPNKGGLVSYTRNLAQEIRKKGNEVEIIVSNSKNSNLQKEEIIEGIKVNRVDFSNVPIYLMFFSPIIYYKRIKKFIKELNIEEEDIVISRFYSFALAVDKVFKHSKHIFIIPLIADKLQKMQAKKAKGIKKIYYYFIMPQIKYLDRKAVKRTTHIGVLSESKKKEVEDYYKIKNVKIMKPGIDTIKFSIPTEKEKINIRNEKKIDVKDKVLLTVCRLETEKNLNNLIKAMSLVKDNNIKLYIVGDGSLKKKLNQLVIEEKLTEKVFLLGAKVDIEKYYKLADVFILPSKYEGFGHVYLEALACGLICIGAKPAPPDCITATEEIIQNEQIGYLMKFNDCRDIAEKIEKAFIESKNNIKYRREYVLNKYTWNDHFSKILRSICNNGTNK